MLQRLLEQCPRAFNVVAGDALYLDPSLCDVILNLNKNFIAILKNEHQDLIKDFRSLLDFEGSAPLRFMHNAKHCSCHNIKGFTSWTQLGAEVRRRSKRRNHRSPPSHQGRRNLYRGVALGHEPAPERAGTTMIVQIGHDRWDIENPGFNELVNQ